MTRRSLVLVTAFLMTMTLAGPAQAGFSGGGTIVRIDHAPDEFVAGETSDVMFTVLWQGDTPVAGASRLGIRPANGTSGPSVGVSFEGTPTGSPGQYIAAVKVPESGTWLWWVEHAQGFTDLGSIEVAPISLTNLLRSDTAALLFAIVTTAGLALFLSRAQIKLGPVSSITSARYVPKGRDLEWKRPSTGFRSE